MRWDPQQYARFSAERSRPFRELLTRVDDIIAVRPSRIVDLGCGPGRLTRELADRWPTASVVGIDSSAEMVAAAAELADGDRLTFERAAVETWGPVGPVELVMANAVLQWVPDHTEQFGRIADWLAPGGVFAFQVPANFDAPSHQLLRELRMSGRWRDRLGADADRDAAVEAPQRYLDTLLALGLDADVWQTEYLHLLTGPDPVLEWTKGTALRPVLAQLDSSEQEAFLADYAAALRTAYVAGAHGTVFPFRRTFAVARRP